MQRALPASVSTTALTFFIVYASVLNAKHVILCIDTFCDALQVNILRDLRHPFIVRYYDRIIDKAATRLYIVMEYCEGGDLGAIIKKCRKEGSVLHLRPCACFDPVLPPCLRCRQVRSSLTQAWPCPRDTSDLVER